MFWLKKLVSEFIYPFSLTVMLLTAGVACLFHPQGRRIGRWLCLAGLVLLFLQGAPMISNEACRILERQYPPVLEYDRLPRDLKWVVVLAGAVNTDPATPVTSRNRGDTLQRTVEGVLLWKRLPGARLLLSGGNLHGRTPAAVIMAELARDLGVPPEAIVLEGKSRDTEEQARFIKEIAGEGRMALVTSAVHMPRSMMLFRRYGLDPIPAPTSYIAPAEDDWPGSMVPTPRGMINTLSCAHEWMGIVWLYAKGLVR